MYSSVFVDMSNFVKSQGVMPSDYHESEIVDIPKCFYAHWSGDEGEAKEDMIIMENLIPKGFAFINGAEVNNNKVIIIGILAYTIVCNCLRLTSTSQFGKLQNSTLLVFA